MGTMVERIQPISPANFLCNMFKIYTKMGNAPHTKLRVPV